MYVRILLAMLLVSGVPLVLVNSQSLHCAHKGFLELQERRQTDCLSEHSETIQSWIDERGATLQMVGVCPTLQNLLANQEVAQAVPEMQTRRASNRIAIIATKPSLV